ncbi:MAG: hydroxymethylglutaryl-CoA reductase, degradative [Conexivisphaerales archaeon]|jgi:hydroxymethylglutaryl-CoA reductase
MSSSLSGLYKLDMAERMRRVKEMTGISDEDADSIHSMTALKRDVADRMIENVIGAIQLPVGVATNFVINGKGYVVPMAIEEPSVIAAASNAAKMARGKGGFHAVATRPLMVAQIQSVGVADPYAAVQKVLARAERILDISNETNPTLVKVGGGAVDIEARVIDTSRGKMVITEITADCRDAMGANTVNTMAETVAPLIESLIGGRVRLRIVSNLATKRLARSWATFDKESLGGADVVEGILDAYAFAEADPFRCTTHNKGIMNGISSVALATGNDTRAIESGAHAYAARSGRYSSLTKYEKNAEGDIVGSIELPIASGILGGATSTHPVAKAAIKILGVKSAQELACVMASVGLAQNLAALRVLATEGISKGHMKLHARNLAVMAGAPVEMIPKVIEEIEKEPKVTYDKVEEIVKRLKDAST